MLTIYGYQKCSSCRNAAKWLDGRGRDYDFIDITEQPPPASTLRAILKQGDHQVKDLFNRSGQVYRQMNLKDRLPTMSEDEAIELLASNGRLIKRPIVTDGKQFTVGFNVDTYEATWG